MEVGCLHSELPPLGLLLTPPTPIVIAFAMRHSSNCSKTFSHVIGELKSSEMDVSVQKCFVQGAPGG